MIIREANISLQSSHQLQKKSTHHESLQVRIGAPQNQRPQPQDNVTLQHKNRPQSIPQTGEVDSNEDLSSADDLNMQIIKKLYKAMTGMELKLFSPKELQQQSDSITYQTQTPAPPPSAGFSLTYQRSSSYHEQEQTSFSSAGIIKTQDGREIQFSTKLNMSREFYRESNLTIQAGDAVKKDPLVINFSGNAAELSTQKFEFDIDADGTLDQISLLKSNSGLLALDKNQDGTINDGSELFGTQSGNGFAELAQYDEDGNQFIDEGDSIYQQLRIWQRHEDGTQQLVALGAKNIGAIYLGHSSTPFQLNTADNQNLGEVTDSGIYLTEQGTVGTVQQLNFTL